MEGFSCDFGDAIYNICRGPTFIVCCDSQQMAGVGPDVVLWVRQMEGLGVDVTLQVAAHVGVLCYCCAAMHGIW